MESFPEKTATGRAIMDLVPGAFEQLDLLSSYEFVQPPSDLEVRCIVHRNSYSPERAPSQPGPSLVLMSFKDRTFLRAIETDVRCLMRVGDCVWISLEGEACEIPCDYFCRPDPPYLLYT